MEMDPALLGWLGFAIAAAAAGLLFQRSRGAAAATEALRAQLDTTRVELEAVQKRLEQGKTELRARGEELADLRKKHDKLKKRAGETLEEEKTLPARVRALESEVAAEKTDSRAARDEIVRLHAELERASADLARERARVVELAPLASKDEIEGLRRRATELEPKVARLGADLEIARHDASKYKGRWETLDKAYVILRGELEMKKDEARNQRVELERLRALEVVLTTSEPEAEPEPRG
jgi:predicted  nucleic acid-binding Zn-ribbon protein